MAKDGKDRTMFDASIETQLLVECLRKAGDSITYEELSKACGCDVRPEGDGYQKLQSARRIVQREDRVVWGTVRKVGLQRLDSSGILSAGAASRAKIHNEARRGIKKLECVDYDKLANGERIAFNATAAGLGAVEAFSKTSSIKRLEKAAEKSAARLSLGETLKAFGG